jgi:hypothetical protein
LAGDFPNTVVEAMFVPDVGNEPTHLIESEGTEWDDENTCKDEASNEQLAAVDIGRHAIGRPNSR